MERSYKAMNWSNDSCRHHFSGITISFALYCHKETAINLFNCSQNQNTLFTPQGKHVNTTSLLWSILGVSIFQSTTTLPSWDTETSNVTWFQLKCCSLQAACWLSARLTDVSLLGNTKKQMWLCVCVSVCEWMSECECVCVCTCFADRICASGVLLMFCPGSLGSALSAGSKLQELVIVFVV